MQRQVAAGQFKAECLKMMNDVQATKQSIVITKRGVPVAKLVPVEEKYPPLFGLLKGGGKELGDIVAPIDEVWDADR